MLPLIVLTAAYSFSEKFALKYDVQDYINLYNKMCIGIGRRNDQPTVFYTV